MVNLWSLLCHNDGIDDNNILLVKIEPMSEGDGGSQSFLSSYINWVTNLTQITEKEPQNERSVRNFTPKQCNGNHMASESFTINDTESAVHCTLIQINKLRRYLLSWYLCTYLFYVCKQSSVVLFKMTLTIYSYCIFIGSL